MSEKENRRPRLIGSEEVSIDEKGRVLLSKKKRDRLGENFAIVLSPLGCLIVYPEVRFDEIYDQIAPGQGFDPAQEALSRMFLGEADDEQNVDTQGRYLIPAKLRDKAGLADRVSVRGMGDRIEIWAKSAWDEYFAEPEIYRTARVQQFGKIFEKAIYGPLGSDVFAHRPEGSE
ncbi:MAG: cell division/cell wall cluster transcriptional repressor MraZ [Armatimonadetes bacterium]|nr:cell division/cell wall cluster transcriptional repressor MraZ [Armatimonadota bacterium]